VRGGVLTFARPSRSGSASSRFALVFPRSNHALYLIVEIKYTWGTLENENTPAQEPESPPVIIPPVDAAPLPSIDTAEPATAQQLANVEKQMSDFEKSTLRWAKIAVVMSFLAALFVCAQWIEMRKGAADTHALAEASHRQADKMTDMSEAADKIREAAQGMVTQDQRIADNARNSLEASNRQSRAALDATIKNFQREQRAWMAVGNETYSIAETGPIVSSAIILNIGKSPATEILCRITGITKLKGYDLLDSDIVYPADLTVVNQGTLFPNQQFPLNTGGPAMDAARQKVWFNNVQSGLWVQYFFGDVRYKDVFGNGHWTRFCTKFVPELKNGTPCPIYNDTDDEKKNQDAN
jgi:hypothetical protein